MPITTRSGKTLVPKSSIRKPPRVKTSLANLPPNALSLIGSHLKGKNIASLYLTSPKYVRNIIKPNLNKQKKIGNLRNKLNFRSTVNTRIVNPSYIQIVKRLQQLNNTPNNVYEMRGNTGTGYHARRIKNMENMLGRLVMINQGRYHNRNNNRYYNFSKGSLVSVPRTIGGVYITVAKGLSKRPNGSLFFNLRKRRS